MNKTIKKKNFSLISASSAKTQKMERVQPSEPKPLIFWLHLYSLDNTVVIREQALLPGGLFAETELLGFFF